MEALNPVGENFLINGNITKATTCEPVTVDPKDIEKLYALADPHRKIQHIVGCAQVLLGEKALPTWKSA